MLVHPQDSSVLRNSTAQTADSDIMVQTPCCPPNAIIRSPFATPMAHWAKIKLTFYENSSKLIRQSSCLFVTSVVSLFAIGHISLHRTNWLYAFAAVGRPY